MTQVLDAGWRLDNLNISFNDYGDYKGKYTGRMQFKNRENEGFTFNIKPEKVQSFIELIKLELSDAATNLGEKMLQSLNLLPPPEGKAQIADAEVVK